MEPDQTTREAFLWGVATSAYQAEGGYNGAGEPQTNWASAEARGDVAPLGQAAEFWTRFEEDFARCRQLGLNAFRLGIEWSRVQPTCANDPSTPPAFDYHALDHYTRMIAECRRHGMEPVVTLHHFVHPAWLGTDPWLVPETADLFVNYVQVALNYINARLIETYELTPVRYYITINEPNMLVLNTYLGTQFPGQAGSGLGNVVRCYNQLFRAHVLAYNALHDLYSEKSWPKPMVTLNNYCSDLYWSDKVFLDLLSVRAKGISRSNIKATIKQKAIEFKKAFRAARIPLHKDLPYYFGHAIKALSYWIGTRTFKPEGFTPLLDTIYASPRSSFLDYVGLDYYDPFAAHLFRLPVWWDHEFKSRSLRSWLMNSVTSKWWDWRILPRGLHFFCEHYAKEYGLPVLIAENGMALRRRTQEENEHRRDRMTRSEFLRLHVREVTRIVQEGIPLIGYLHWSLFDNYEWGTYTPRFGLYSLHFKEGTERLVEDQFGDKPSETYAALIANARSIVNEPHAAHACPPPAPLP